MCHTTSSYPAPAAELNLRMIHTLAYSYPDVPIGYSGHEIGLQTSIAAVALGACFVERHITLDRALWGSDQAASIEPAGVARLVRDIRVVESALGDGVKRVYDSELPIQRKLRRATRRPGTVRFRTLALVESATQLINATEWAHDSGEDDATDIVVLAPTDRESVRQINGVAAAARDSGVSVAVLPVRTKRTAAPVAAQGPGRRGPSPAAGHRGPVLALHPRRCSRPRGPTRSSSSTTGRPPGTTRPASTAVLRWCAGPVPARPPDRTPSARRGCSPRACGARSTCSPACATPRRSARSGWPTATSWIRSRHRPESSTTRSICSAPRSSTPAWWSGTPT